MRHKNQTSYVSYSLLIVGIFICWLLSFSSRAVAVSAAPDASSLQIVVLQGEDGVNIIKSKTAVKPVVQVRDKSKFPGVGAVGAGVVVVFVLEDKRSAQFPKGETSASVTTDANGRAEAPNFRPTGKGSYKIEIRASYQGQTVSRTITQVNFKNVKAARKAGRVPGSSHGDPEAQSASQTASQGAGGTSGAAGGAAGAGTTVAAGAAVGAAAGQAAGGTGGVAASTAGGATAATAASHTGLIIGAIAAGGAAAAGVGYYEATKSSGPNCNTQGFVNQLEADASSIASACQGASAPLKGQCKSSFQSFINELNSLCSCAGSAAVSQANSILSQLGYPDFASLNAALGELGLSGAPACQ